MSSSIKVQGIHATTIQIIDQMPEIEFDDHETHYDTPFGGVPLDLLSNPIARESFAQMYSPSLELSNEEDGENITSALGEIFLRNPPQALEYRVGGCGDPLDLVARIEISYPLNDTFACDFKFKSNRLGEIFSCVHDMYETIYMLDDAKWKSSGNESIPRIAPGVLNRAKGDFIWGHDMSDLIISGFEFSLVSDYPKIVHKGEVALRIPRGGNSSAARSTIIPDYIEYEKLINVDFSKLKNGHMIGKFIFILSS